MSVLSPIYSTVRIQICKMKASAFFVIFKFTSVLAQCSRSVFTFYYLGTIVWRKFKIILAVFSYPKAINFCVLIVADNSSADTSEFTMCFSIQIKYFENYSVFILRQTVDICDYRGQFILLFSFRILPTTHICNLTKRLSAIHTCE